MADDRASVVLAKLRTELAGLDNGSALSAHVAVRDECLEESINNLTQLKDEHRANIHIIECMLQREDTALMPGIPADDAVPVSGPVISHRRNADNIPARPTFSRPLLRDSASLTTTASSVKSTKPVHLALSRSKSPAPLASMSEDGASGSGDPVAAPTVPVRLQRPASAPPRQRPRITVPQPFSFELRQSREHASTRRLRVEMETEKLRVEAERAARKPVPVPPTTVPGLYQAKVNADQAASRRRRTLARTIIRPFSFSKSRNNCSLGAKTCDSTTNCTRLNSDPPTFSARQVPRAMSEPRYEWMQLEDARRRERIAQVRLASSACLAHHCPPTFSSCYFQEALRSLQLSKLPPRMQRHKDTARARRSADHQRIQAELDVELTLHPAITESVPQFAQIHAQVPIPQGPLRAQGP